MQTSAKWVSQHETPQCTEQASKVVAHTSVAFGSQTAACASTTVAIVAMVAIIAISLLLVVLFAVMTPTEYSW